MQWAHGRETANSQEIYIIYADLCISVLGRKGVVRVCYERKPCVKCRDATRHVDRCGSSQAGVLLLPLAVLGAGTQVPRGSTGRVPGATC